MFDANFFILQKSKLKRFFLIFKKGNWAKILVIFLTGLIFLGLGVGVFLFSLISFKFLGQYPKTSQLIITYTLAVTFIFTSVLILASSIITSLGALFQRDDNLLLFSLPIKTPTIFESRLVDVLALASWPLFVFALPQVLGYGFALQLKFSSMIIFLFGVLSLTFIAGLSGVIVALIIARVWGNIGNKILGLILLLSVPFLAWGLMRLLLPPVFLTNLESLSLPEIAQLLKHQAFLSPFLPTTWLVNLVSFWREGPLLAFKNLAFLFFSYLAILILVLVLRGKFYLQAVGKTSQGRFIASKWDEVKKRVRTFPYVLKGRVGALTEKDWLVVFRTPNQVFQIAFIIFLEIVYLLIIIRLPLARLRRLFPNWYQNQLLVFNFLFINYLVSVFSMRFLFPMISLEGHSAWIVWSAPVKRMKVFWQKFLSSFLIIFIWLEISTLLSIKTFRLSPLTQWPLFLINLPLSLTVVAISLGMGAIKPNFWEKNPEKLSTSPGGIMATALCLAYIGGVGFFTFVQKGASIFNPLAHLTVWSISFFIAMPILLQVSQRIKRYEV